MPRLNLLSEYDPNSGVCVLLFDDRDDLVVESLENLRGERTDVIQIHLDRMFCFCVRSRGKQLPGELGWKSHFGVRQKVKFRIYLGLVRVHSISWDSVTFNRVT